MGGSSAGAMLAAWVGAGATGTAGTGGVGATVAAAAAVADDDDDATALSLVIDIAGDVFEGNGWGGGARGPDRLP